MCAIGGVYLRSGQMMDVPLTLTAMLQEQGYRGPDNQGQLWLPDDGIGLCHNRLAVVDLTDRGNQPMVSSDSNCHIVFNGEIYNWREIRRNLESLGEVFHSSSDTEVLLVAYRTYGIDVLKHIRGSFAFAIYDKREDLLFCARDIIGKKPFVYSESTIGFAFASSIPALLKVPNQELSINHSALASMLVHNMRNIPDPYTAYGGIKKLNPGHAVIVRRGRVDETWRYWVPKQLEGVDADSLRDVIEEAVAIRSVADVPVGALLSGGIDSTAIVNLMRKHTDKQIRTYAFGAHEDDEDIIRARQMANYLGTAHKEFYFDATRQYSILKNIIASFGEPIMLLPLVHAFELSEAVRNDGIKVVLTGTGADELFFGYLGHVSTAKYSSWLYAMEPLLKIGRMIPKFARVGPLPFVLANKGERKSEYYRWKAKREWPSFVSKDILPKLTCVVADEMEALGHLVPNDYFIDESNYLSLFIDNAHSVAIASDFPGMLASVEMRSPFLDQKVVEAAMSIHYTEKVKLTPSGPALKYILKQAVRDLMPVETLNAPKRGFGLGVPETDLLKGEWKEFGNELFSSPDDCDGLLNKNAMKRLWEDFVDNKSSNPAVSRLFAIQLWRQECCAD